MLIVLIIAALFGTVTCLAVAVLGRKQTSLMESRIQTFRTQARTERDDLAPDLELSFGERVLRPGIENLARTATNVLPQSVMADIQYQLAMAGHPMKMNTFVTFWMVSTLVFGGIGFLAMITIGGIPAIAVAIGLLIFGYMVPRFWLKGRVKTKQKAVIRALPDNLDLITTCVEAGLGLDAALARVAEQGEGPLAYELHHMLRDVAMGKLRREAMQEMADRVGVEQLSNFITSIIQAEQLGVSIAQVLRVQSDQMRTERRQRAERQAHEAPIKMIFPLVLLIFPAFLAVILSPAVLRISEQF